MTTKIEIKPNDQSWVGKKIKNNNWGETEYFEILYVGNKSVFGRYQNGEELHFALDIYSTKFFENWVIYEEPEKECEYEWENLISYPHIKCKLCNKISYKEDLQEYWLKVGDVIEDRFDGKRYKIIQFYYPNNNLNAQPVSIYVINLKTKINKLINNDQSIKEFYKKIRLASPALYKSIINGSKLQSFILKYHY